MNLVPLAVIINFLGIVFCNKIQLTAAINLLDSTEKRKSKK